MEEGDRLIRTSGSVSVTVDVYVFKEEDMFIA
jgi:hypothetical protein